MLTRKLHIIEIDNSAYIKHKQKNYSYAFRRLYKMLDEASDYDFIFKFKQAFSLNDIEYRSLLSEVKSFRDREITLTKEKEQLICELNKQLENKELSKKEIYSIHRKIRKLSKNLGKESAFGGRNLQRRLTIECNKTGILRNEEKITQLKEEFHKKRILPFYIMGEANQKGNRFFDISKLCSEGIVIYKPQKGIKIQIKVKVPRKFQSELKKLSELTQSKNISISVYLSTENICISFDEENLNDYGLDIKGQNAGVKEIKQNQPREIQKDLIKDLYKRFYDDQRSRKLEGKIKDRVCAVDLNPEYIGFSILDKKGTDIKIVDCGLISFKKLMSKTHKSSSSAESKYRNNKHKYEVTIVVKWLLKLMNHYRCSSFVVEELDFKDKESLGREANRKTKNLWYRTLLLNCITRRCNENGIEIIEVNPCYSSFIGNIQHKLVDATNASIEIGRRGLMKYNKGGFYPLISEDDIHTLESKFGNVVEYSTADNWVNIYKSLVQIFSKSEFAQRLRTGIDEFKGTCQSFSINSYKSKALVYNFI